MVTANEKTKIVVFADALARNVLASWQRRLTVYSGCSVNIHKRILQCKIYLEPVFPSRIFMRIYSSFMPLQSTLFRKLDLGRKGVLEKENGKCPLRHRPIAPADQFAPGLLMDISN